MNNPLQIFKPSSLLLIFLLTTIIINAQTNQYTITTASYPSTGGTTLGGGTFAAGTIVHVKAIKSNGYYFIAWKENGNIVSTDTSYSFSVTSNKTLIAHFEKWVKVNIIITPTEGGSVSGGGTYRNGENVTLTATPSSQYKFTDWKENGFHYSYVSSFSFKAQYDRNFEAVFTPVTYQIDISSNPPSFGTTKGAGRYDYGTNLKISAIPCCNTIDFAKWTNTSGVLFSREKEYTFKVNTNLKLVANFGIKVNVSSSPQAGGIVSSSGVSFEGEIVSVTAKPNKGYVFVKWVDSHGDFSTQQNWSHLIGAGEAGRYDSFTAIFAPIQYSVLVSSNPPDGGTTTGGGVFNYGTTITLNAEPFNNYKFVSWSTDSKIISNSQKYLFSVDTSRTIIANFVKKNYSVTLSANPIGGGTVSGSGTFEHGTNVSIMAIAKNITGSKYKFVNWSEGGTEVSKSSNYAFTIEANRNLVANFVDITSIEKMKGMPTNYSLEQNFPNPFNPTTQIQFSLPKEAFVRLTIFNSIGQVQNVLVNNHLGVGTYSVSFDASSLSTGIYFYKLIANDFVQIKKMNLIK